MKVVNTKAFMAGASGIGYVLFYFANTLSFFLKSLKVDSLSGRLTEIKIHIQQILTEMLLKLYSQGY